MYINNGICTVLTYICYYVNAIYCIKILLKKPPKYLLLWVWTFIIALARLLTW